MIVKYKASSGRHHLLIISNNWTAVGEKETELGRVSLTAYSTFNEIPAGQHDRGGELESKGRNATNLIAIITAVTLP